MIIEAIQKAVDTAGRRYGIRNVSVEHDGNGKIFLKGITNTYYKRQVVLEAAKAQAGQLQIVDQIKVL